MQFIRICRIISILIILLISYSYSMADIIDIGGKRIEIVDGKLSDKLAEEVLVYSKNLYDRGSYRESIDVCSKMISKYRGKYLCDFYFLRAKNYFMYYEFDKSFKDFLFVYEAFPNCNIIKSNTLSKTIEKVNLRLLNKLKETYKLDRYLDPLVKFHALYQYITGKTLKEVDDFLSKDSVKTTKYDISIWGQQPDRKYTSYGELVWDKSNFEKK